MKEEKTSGQENTLYFRVHARNLLNEISENNQMAVARKPLKIMFDILRLASKRALELGDEKMIAIMCALTMYNEVDPESAEHNEDAEKKMMDVFSEYIKDDIIVFVFGAEKKKTCTIVRCSVCGYEHSTKSRIEMRGCDQLYRSCCPTCGATEVV